METTEKETSSLPAGTVAPGFTLESPEGEISLSDYRGQPVILVFYPADNSPVCSNQLALYNEAISIFSEHDAALLAISTDDVEAHAAFAAGLGLAFPLLADDDPPGAIAGRYGVFDEKRGTAQRALFVLDADGVIRWRHVSPPGVNPGAHGILAALDQVAPV